MNGSCLLLDAGNSRLKWAIVEGERWSRQGVCDYADLELPVHGVVRAYAASVTAAGNVERLNAMLTKARIPVRWLVSASEFGSLKNAYATPNSLGVDRWMALIAAERRIPRAALVISVGTAMTIDALAGDGRFLGGVIVPGRVLMRTALAQGTAGIDVGNGVWRDFPRETADAVESGILSAMCGAVEAQRLRLAALCGEAPHCLITGGDASRLLPHLATTAEHVPALVLEGLAIVAREEGAA